MARREKLDEEGAQQIARALADPRRYTILKSLAAHNPLSTCAYVRERLDISPATLSHHMKELKLAGLVDEVWEGRNVSYVLCGDVLEEFMKRLRCDLL